MHGAYVVVTAHAAANRLLVFWPQISPITPIFLDWAGFVTRVDQAFGLKRLVTEFEEQADRNLAALEVID